MEDKVELREERMVFVSMSKEFGENVIVFSICGQS
jgi:hypothetical protein